VVGDVRLVAQTSSPPAYDDAVDLADVDINLLVAFDALMSEGGVTAAANRMHVGQSAMSATLLRLRRLLDDPVLVRTGRTMAPTPLALSLTGPIRDALNQIDQLLTARPSFDPTRDHRTFSIMASEYATVAVLHPLSVKLRKVAPNVSLRISPVAPTFVEDLTHNKCDLVILPPQFVGAGSPLHAKVLYEDPYVVAVDKSNPKVKDSIDLALFTSLPYLAQKSSGVRALVETQLDRLGIERRTEVTTDFGLAPFLLRDTLLVTLIPVSFASFLAEGVGLKLLEPPMRLDPVTESMFWTSHRDDEPAHRWLRTQLLEMAGPLRSQHSRGE
jgi:DNA-binding transcriptional LysR family regulator